MPARLATHTLLHRVQLQWVLVWLGLCLILPGTAQADTSELVISPDMQFAYADTLFQKKDFTAAQVEFKRFIHFFSQDPRVTEAAFKTGMALFHQEQFHDAARQFNDIISNDPDLSCPYTREAFSCRAGPSCTCITWAMPGWCWKIF